MKTVVKLPMKNLSVLQNAYEAVEPWTLGFDSSQFSAIMCHPRISDIMILHTPLKSESRRRYDRVPSFSFKKKGSADNGE